MLVAVGLLSDFAVSVTVACGMPPAARTALTGTFTVVPALAVTISEGSWTLQPLPDTEADSR